jgi:DNA-binding winged helix-turn-helix (wHTH) protein/tetratricopeptide (TPR) repeat protein
VNGYSQFSIGSLEVDATARRIRVGDTDLRVEPKVFDLLLYLARHQGRAIGQDELLEQVWGRTVASDAVVAQAVHKLRVLLRTEAGISDGLVTLRGVGYRLDALVVESSHSGASRPRALSWSLALAAVVLVTGLFTWWQAWRTTAAAAPRIALLSMDNATGVADLEWVRAGATAMMSELLQGHGIEVVTAADLDTIGQAVADEMDPVALATDIAGVRQVFAPRLLPDSEGYRLELVDLTDASQSRLELAGTGPATLSLGMAGLLAERLQAPLHPPSGSLGLGNPFLDEAYARAYHHRQKGELDDARKLYRYILREVPDAHWARYHLSITLRNAGDMEASRQELEQLFEVSLDDAWLDAAIRSTMGNLEWYAGNLDRAETLYIEARGRFDAHAMTGGAASALGNLGMVAFSRADFDSGRHYATQALDIYRRQGNRIQAARMLHNIGYSYFDQGQLDDALFYLEQAHSIRVELGLNIQAANTRTVIAEIAIDQGRLEEGSRLLEKALATFSAADNARGRGRTLADLARVANRRGDYQQARDRALESLSLAQARNESASIGKAALILGRSLHALGDWYGADEHLRQSEAVWKKLENTPGRITCLAERVRVALDRDDLQDANRFLNELEELAHESGDERYFDTLRTLRLQTRLSAGDLAGITEEFDALLTHFDHRRFDHAELIIELAEALHSMDAVNPLLTRFRPAAEYWATRYFPAARYLYRSASGAKDCSRAAHALQQLMGPEWRRSLPPVPACETGQS